MGPGREALGRPAAMPSLPLAWGWTEDGLLRIPIPIPGPGTWLPKGTGAGVLSHSLPRFPSLCTVPCAPLRGGCAVVPPAALEK